MKRDRKAPRRSPGTADPRAAYPEMTGAGWEYRGSGEKAQVEKLRQLYEEMGLDVKVLPLRTADIPEDCLKCPQGKGDIRRYRVLFTRPRR